MNFKMKPLRTAITAGLIASASVFAQAVDIPAGVELADVQTLKYSDGGEFTSLDPAIMEDVSGSRVARDLFEGLINQDGKGQMVPGVAMSWEASNGNKTWTFKLRQDAKWSNGDPVTANDFVYSWQRAASPELASPYGWYIEYTNIVNAAEVLAGEVAPSELGVEATDDYTLVVNLKKPLPYFPKMVSHSTLFPVHQATVEEFGSDWTKPGNIVSNGAYTLESHIVNEKATWVKNEQYWDADAVVITRVERASIENENQWFAQYNAGDLHIVQTPTGQYPRLSKEVPEETFVFPRLCTYYYIFNTTDPVMSDVRVRTALSYAIDRDLIVKAVTKAGQIPAYTFTPGATADFVVPEVEFGNMSQKERDARAKELLAEAGYGPSNPLSVELLYNTSEGHKKIAIAVQQMWKRKLGVETELMNQEWNTFLETRKNADFQVARSGWCGDYNEASTFLSLLKSDNSQNDSKYMSDAYDALVNEAAGSANAAPLYTQMEELIANDMPIAPIYFYTGVRQIKPFVKNYPVDNVENNVYSKDTYLIKM